MYFVSSNRIEQQDIQNIHRIRERNIKQRTALCNQILGILAEYGIIIPKGIGFLRKELSLFLEVGELRADPFLELFVIKAAVDREY